jgi:hypothetical protein
VTLALRRPSNEADKLRKLTPIGPDKLGRRIFS